MSDEVCGRKCDHGSECLKLKGHGGAHDTQHGCMFYEARHHCIKPVDIGPLGNIVARGSAGDRCESGNECGRLGCPECQE